MIEDSSLVVINCRNMNMSTVPPVTGSSDHIIYELTLAQNNIQVIPAAAFDGLRVQRLDLRENRLTSISSNAFAGLENELLELYLGAEVGASIEPPVANLTHLTVLDTLHMEYFKFPSDFLGPSHSLHSLSSLKSLTLRHNGLDSVQSGTLPTSLTSLTLDNQGFTSYPLDGLRSLVNLETLAITHTSMSVLSYKMFELHTRLRSLNLGYNRISVLNSGCFFGIETSLEVFSLRNNPVPSEADPVPSVVALDEIKELTALTSLDLSETTLAALPAGAAFLLNKASLRSLHLEGNAFTTLGPNVFSGVGAGLGELGLARNQLAGTDEQAFAGLSALTSLDLGHQTASQALSLPASLATLASLRTLRLSGSRLDPAALWGAVGPLASLRTLRLDATSLSSVAGHAFRNLTQLSELNLDGNGLTEVTQDMMAGPRALAKLTLNNNRISAVSSCAFHGFFLRPALALELLGNPLHCDCRLRWLVEEVAAGAVELAGAEKCATPPRLENAFLSTLGPGELTCVSPPPDAPCSELYTTPAPPTTTPTPVLGLSITNVSATSISMRWVVESFPGLAYFRVRLTELETGVTTQSEMIGKEERSFRQGGLRAGRAYTVCIYASGSPPGAVQTSCLTRVTLAAHGSGQGGLGDGSSETGIIVGTVIGAVALLAIVAAILYLVLRRKRSQKDLQAQAQPHVFAASELPGMGAHTKQFTRPKNPPPKVGRAMAEAIKVTVISDGRAASPRQSAGSYQFLDEKQPYPYPNPNPGVSPPPQPQGGSSSSSYHYSKGVDGRSLPTAPEDFTKGYYTNNGFHKDTAEESPAEHTYNQIDQ